MRELTTQDNGTMVLFLDGMMTVPAIGPDSDMDGHDLSGLTYSETLDCEDWIEIFNDNYLDKAKIANFMGMKVIVVKDFIDEELFGGEDEDDNRAELPESEKEKAIESIAGSWDMLFDLTPEEKEYYKGELRKKFGIR